MEKAKVGERERKWNNLFLQYIERQEERRKKGI
jgi:hypothetical protein